MCQNVCGLKVFTLLTTRRQDSQKFCLISQHVCMQHCACSVTFDWGVHSHTKHWGVHSHTKHWGVHSHTKHWGVHSHTKHWGVHSHTKQNTRLLNALHVSGNLPLSQPIIQQPSDCVSALMCHKCSSSYSISDHCQNTDPSLSLSPSVCVCVCVDVCARVRAYSGKFRARPSSSFFGCPQSCW